jgi:hypothetical protein
MKSELARGLGLRSRLLASAIAGAVVLLATTGVFVSPAHAQGHHQYGRWCPTDVGT